MTPLDVAFPQQLAAPQEPHMGNTGYTMKPQQPNVQFGHMPHTDHMLRGNNAPPPGMAPPHGATPLGGGPNVEHHEQHAPQYDYSHPQMPPPQMQQQQHPQHMQQQQHMHPSQMPPQHMQQQRMAQPHHGGRPSHMQHHPQHHPQHQRLAQQTGPAPVAAEVITKTKTGMSTNKILLIVLVAVIFIGIGVGTVVLCKKNKKQKLELGGESAAAVFRASEFQ